MGMFVEVQGSERTGVTDGPRGWCASMLECKCILSPYLLVMLTLRLRTCYHAFDPLKVSRDGDHASSQVAELADSLRDRAR
jgi:hypothetical protein